MYMESVYGIGISSQRIFLSKTSKSSWQISGYQKWAGKDDANDYTCVSACEH